VRPQPILTGRAARPTAPGPAAPATAALATAAVAAGLLLAACGGGAAPAAVPSLSHAASAPAGGSSRASELRAATSCIRQHGIPGFQDPVLTPSGQVYSDQRSFQDASPATLSAVLAACGALMTRAGLNPNNEPPAPPQLVQAGVAAARCVRAHGLPNMRDPTANSPYTPGHGFGISGDEIPAGGKLSHSFQEAYRACLRQVTAEIRASTLSSLASDG
jgi:hypothetical protein